MIIMKISGGLASQIHKYMIGHMLSKRMSTELQLDLTWFDNIPEGDTNREFLLRHYPIEINVASDADIKRLKPNRVNRFIKRYLPINSHSYSGVSFFDKKYVNSLNPPIYIEGEWFGDELIAECLNEFKKIFKKELQCDLPKITYNTASIHVRRGDFYANENARKLHGVVGEQYYLNAMKLANKMGYENFVVFSDDIEWVKSHYFENVSYKLEYCHVDDCISEFEIMKTFDLVITSNSGFSWLSGWLGNSSYIISPKRWVSDENVNSRILKNLIDNRMIFL